MPPIPRSPQQTRRCESAACGVFAALFLSLASSPAGLVWHSPLDGNADASVGADGVPTGSPTAAADRFGNASSAVEFSGIGQFYGLGDLGMFTAGSMAVWAKADTNSSERGIMAAGASGGGSARYFSAMNNSGGLVRVDLDNGFSRRDAQSNSPMTIGQWSHVVTTWSGSGTLRVYIDGVQQSDTQGGLAASYEMSFDGLVGAERTTERFWDGCLDDAGIWDEELSARKVAAMHGLAKFVGTGQDDPAIDTVVAFGSLGQSASIGGETWVYVDGLSGVTGATGGSIAGDDAFVVLDGTSGRGIQQSAIILPPTVTNSPATGITPGGATLGGIVTDTGGEAPSITIYWGTSNGGTSPGSWSNSQVIGTSAGAFSADVTTLSPSTTYFFRCFAQNSAGSDWAGSSSSFTTLAPPDPPAVITLPATAISYINATVNGQVTDDGGDPPLVGIYYGDNDGGTDENAWDELVFLGNQTGVFSETLNALMDGTTYFFRARALNAAGDVWASTSESFTTLAFQAPSLTNSAASNITGGGALVGGEVTATGGDSPTVTIHYGPADGGTNPGSWANSIDIGVQSGAFSTGIGGLSPNTTYFYTASGTNLEGTGWATPSLSFTTPDVSELFINEFMASNSGATPVPNQVPGTSDDWIEIANIGATPFDLGGWHLTDNPGELDKWTFPAGTSIPAGGYLVVFASGDNTPDANGNLHTNFRLSAGGDYIALVRPTLTIANEFGPAGADYPEQQQDISYGLHPSSGDSVYFQTPTPGAANDPGGILLVADTKFSHKRGYYTAPFAVTITTDTSGATIRYTTDGTEPTLSNGGTYTAPISITTTTVLRARAYNTGQLETNTDTQSYIFPADVASQTKPPGYPNNWGNNDYDVDTSISQSGTYAARFQEGLRSVPTVSLVGDPLDFFGPDGIWVDTQDRSREAPVSAEYFHPDASADGVNVLEGFQIDCGAKLQGGASRNPSSAVKHSMSMRFRDIYGTGKLDFPVFEDTDVTTFDSLHLRAMYNNSWVHRDSGQRARATMIRDQWARDCMIDMGNADGGHGHYAHVYINGLYWGLFNLHERLENDHYAAYNGYEDDEVLGRNPGSPTSEENASFNAMTAVVTNTSSTWSEIRAVLDVENYIDYVIVEYFGRNADLKSNDNWRAAGGGSANAPWRFYCWDTERILESESNTSPPSNSGRLDGALIFDDLEKNREFRVLFADRAYKALFNGGALTNLANRDRFQKYADEIDTAIVCESARWGDDRGTTYTRDNHWTRAVYGTPGGPGTSPTNGVLNSWFPLTGTNRTERMITSWKSRTFTNSSDTYLGTIDAPVFTVNGSPQHGGEIPAGGNASATATSGNIYYTTDGSDPRLEGGGLAPGATLLGGNITLGASGLVRARARVGSGDSWSPLTEAVFYLEQLPGAGDVAISEINYHPRPPTTLEGQAAGAPFSSSDFEFVEVVNLAADAINLEGVTFGDGVVGTAGNYALSPGAHAVFAANPQAFAARYGTTAPVAGTFTGELSNNGETVQLLAADATPLDTVTYEDGGPWPGRPDGGGSSLERVNNTANPDNPKTWRSSSEYGGSPGAAGLGPDNRIVINEVLSHTDLPQTDTIELFNTTGAAIDISGWYLSDSSDVHRSFGIPDATSVNGGAYLTFDEGDFNAPAANPITSFSGTGGASPTTVTAPAHGLGDGDVVTISGYGGFGDYNASFEVDVIDSSSFTIDAVFLDDGTPKGTWTPGRPFALSSSRGETVYLIEADATGKPVRFVDVVDFAGALNGETLGRWPNGAGSSTITPMLMDTLGGANTGPRVGPVIISEVHYHPDAPIEDNFEFVELCNTGATTENLAEWRMRGGADFNFTAAHQLAPGGLLVVVAFDPIGDPVAANAFRTAYGIDAAIPLVGPFTDGPLNNDTGTVRLQRADSPPLEDPGYFPQVTEDTVTYFNTFPWPEDANGDGLSLNRLGNSFGDFATSWEGAAPTPGGKVVDYSTWADGFGVGPGEEDHEADGVSNLIEYYFGLNPLVFDANLLPEIVTGPDTISLTIVKDLTIPNVISEIQRSTDLENWTDVPTTIDSSTAYSETHTATVSTSGEERIFLRIFVEETP